MRNITAIFIFLLVFEKTLFAAEVSYLARSPLALLRGDTNIARAKDSYTLFYNPAGLARNGLGVQASLLNPSIGVTNALDDIDRFKNFPSSDASAIAQRLLGFPVYVQTGISPSLKVGPIGFSLFSLSKTSFVLRNATHPRLDIDYRQDNGFIVGVGHAFSIRGGSKSKNGMKLNLGGSAKRIVRKGLKSRFDLFGTKLLNLLSTGITDIADFRDSLGFSEGKGWGFDLGGQLVMSSGASELSFGLTAQNIGGINFKKTSGTGIIPKEEMAVGAGVSWSQDFTLLDYEISLDLAPLNYDIDFARKIHAGIKIGIPLISLYGGFSEGYISYGAGLNIWFIELTAGFYSVELGSLYKQEKGDRFIFYLSLLDFSFGQ